MNSKAMDEVCRTIRRLGAKQTDIDNIKLNLGVMREGWGQLFT